MSRPSWDELWMTFAVHLAERSTCKRAQVGCVVVSGDNQRVLAVGYNGGPRGLWNDCLSDEPGKCGHLHSEVNALLKLNTQDPARKVLYTSWMPCFNCAIAIVNADLDEVVYLNDYRSDDGVKLLGEAGIDVRKYQGIVRLKEDRS